VSARTLENRISRLLASEFAEVRGLGKSLRLRRRARVERHYDEARVLCEEVRSVDKASGRRLADALLRR